MCLNSLVPRRFEWNFRKVGFNVISVVDDWGISCEVAFRWMSPDITYDKSTLDQVMAWCRQGTSHFLSQCWPRSKQAYFKCRYISIYIYYMWYIDMWLMTEAYLLKLNSDECHRTLLMISQQWFRKWLVSWRHQAITWNIETVPKDVSSWLRGFTYLNFNKSVYKIIQFTNKNCF